MDADHQPTRTRPVGDPATGPAEEVVGEVVGAAVRLVPGTVALFDAELDDDLVTLAALLGVGSIGEWPPLGGEHDRDAVCFFRNTLLEDPALEGWLAHYVLRGDELVASAGFHGAPVDGVAEIGYSVCQGHRRRGIATAAVRALIDRAGRAGVHRLVAHVEPDNVASIRVLERTGFATTTAIRNGQLSYRRAR